ncbi:hypothetical protein [Micromonospora sp. WMMD964]|uniref:hypothetical protein n=1 Tax=Micromonospora sp. WMMD964 TaxID=3016091 RepID=UPI00249AE200|nr:hypothetical protein [Micromonospora sp. WMMD964]WFF00705.1 hypothetical protein O7616_28205 [Micromonospora sp. WMMD964]
MTTGRMRPRPTVGESLEKVPSPVGQGLPRSVDRRPTTAPTAPVSTPLVAAASLRFSPEAAAEHAAAIAKYISSLELISRAIADQKQSDDVSAHHVRTAAESLGTSGSKRDRRLSEMGTLLTGAALGYLGNVAISDDYTWKNFVIFTVPFAIGLFLYAYTLGRD